VDEKNVRAAAGQEELVVEAEFAAAPACSSEPSSTRLQAWRGRMSPTV
jgi:hypothetical protein